MTPGTGDRPLMPIEDFEDLAEVAPKGVRLEYVDGRVQTKDQTSISHRSGESKLRHTARAEHARMGSWRLWTTSRATESGPTPPVP